MTLALASIKTFENQVIHCDALTLMRSLPSESIHCIVTSPPYYGLRDYGTEGQLGLEETPESYIAKLSEIFMEARRVLKSDGTLWLNLGDSYTGSGKGGQSDEKRSNGWQPDYANKGATYGLEPKNLLGIPWRVALSLQSDGWILRSDIIWHKPNPMPESVTDRPTKSHEYIFLFAKSGRYFYNADAVREKNAYIDNRQFKSKNHYGIGIRYHDGAKDKDPNVQRGVWMGQNPNGRNKRSVWTIATKPFPGAHFAVFPPKLIEPCILAGCPSGGIVLDPFMGSGTTALVARQHGRRYIGSELNEQYVSMARQRLAMPYTLPMFTEKVGVA